MQFIRPAGGWDTVVLYYPFNIVVIDIVSNWGTLIAS